MLPDRVIKGLLVEDEAPHIRLFERNVKRMQIPLNFEVVTDGQAAVNYLNANAAALSREAFVLVLDLNLPIMSGFEVLEFMKADARFRDIPVIILTTSDDPHDLARIDAFGIKHHLVKPIDFERFGKLLNTIMS